MMSAPRAAPMGAALRFWTSWDWHVVGRCGYAAPQHAHGEAFMSTTATETPPAAALDLREAVEIQEGAVQADRTVKLHLIRPCIGRGRGTHYYSAQMLEANAHKFVGAKMYVN